jgi:tetratricopeptide (TPR) repeat protein
LANTDARSSRLSILLGVMALLVVSSTASAQSAGPPSTADEEAHLRFEAGRVAYQRGGFEDALTDFQRAYELSHRYELLYNLGSTYDHLRRDAEAIDAFSRFLAEAPESDPNRLEVERRIAVMREAQPRAVTDVAPAPVQTPAPEPAPPTSSPDPAPWIVVGVGAAALVAGAIVLAVGVSDQSTVESATSPTRWTDLMDAYGRAPVLQGVGIAALVVGAIGVGAGLGWALTSGGSSETARLRIGPTSLSLEGSF